MGDLARFLPSATLALFVVLAGVAPTVAASGIWRDEFVDLGLVASAQGVRTHGGEIQLSPVPAQREGRQLPSISSTGSPSMVNNGSSQFLYFTMSNSGIHLATSPDGSAWNWEGVVIPPGFAGPSDAQIVTYGDVIIVGNVFHMWYSGYSGAYSIHHATSTDGRSWTSGGVVLDQEIENGSAQWVYAPSVIWDGSSFTMWYTTYDGATTAIRRATSLDGISWTRHGSVLRAFPDGNDNAGPRMPAVVRLPFGYVMWYACVAAWEGKICRARSPDGANWTREGLMLAPEPSVPGEEVGLSDPTVIASGPGTVRLLYVARGANGDSNIHSAILTDGMFVAGRLISVPISLPENETWQWLAVRKNEPPGTSIMVSVLNGTDGVPIQGHEVLTQLNNSLSCIDPRRYPVIALSAVLSGDGATTPGLLEWEVAYGPRLPCGPGEIPPIVIIVLVAAGVFVAAAAVVLKWTSTSRRPPGP